MSRLLRQQLLRLSHQTRRALLLDLVRRDARRFLRLYYAVAGFGAVFSEEKQVRLAWDYECCDE
jgi:hypothetical protein